MPSHIWVIDDDASSRELLARVLRQRGWQVEQLSDGREALERLAAGKAPDLVVSDIRMAEVDGLAVTEAFRRDAPDTPVILVTAFGNVDGAVEAIRRGAFDYVSKPYDVDAVQLTAARALEQRRLAEENRALRRQLRDKYRLENAVGRSEAMLQVFKTAARVAASDATVLILGESGTGKELVARALHQASPRAAGPFVPVDCGAIAEGVLESELFGHARGAFTGAQTARRGLFEEAGSGTLFLDEIGDVGPGLQARLLRALQEGTIRRVGTNETVPVDARVVAATNRDLTAMVATRAFRDDLYFRLNVGSIHLAPLRERPDDIDALARHFLVRWNQRLGRRVAGISGEAFATLRRHTWPGNVRELGNFIERAMVAADGNVILPGHLPPLLGARTSTPSAQPPALTLEAAEREQILRALKAAGGRRTAAARLLGLSRRTLYRKLDRHGIP